MKRSHNHKLIQVTAKFKKLFAPGDPYYKPVKGETAYYVAGIYNNRKDGEK